MSTIKVGRPDHLREHEVYAMVEERLGKEEITDACAVTIASWWQSPRGNGYAMAQLASTGTVDYEDLKDSIHLTRREAVEHYGASSPDVAALDMLGTWALHVVKASEDPDWADLDLHERAAEVAHAEAFLTELIAPKTEAEAQRRRAERDAGRQP